MYLGRPLAAPLLCSSAVYCRPVTFPNSCSLASSSCVSSCPRACLNSSSQAVLAGIAANLRVDVEDLDFADISFSQGSAFPVENEFDVGHAELSSARGKNPVRTECCRLLLHTWPLVLTEREIASFVSSVLPACPGVSKGLTETAFRCFDMP